MDALLIAIAALFVGIAIVPWLKSRAGALAAVDGFVVAAIGGVVVVHLLPYSLVEAGWPAAVAAVVGLVLPGVLERKSAARDGVGSASTLLALAGVGLAVHAFLDGAALASAEHEHGAHEALALAVVLHRLPMGLVLGLLTRTRRYAPWLLGLAVAGATAAGFGLGHEALPAVGVRGLAVLQALVAGSLLHVVFAHPPGELGPSNPRTRAASGVGALAGLAVTAELALDHPVARHCEAELGARGALAELSLDAAPWLVAALLGTGLLSALVRLDHQTWLRGKSAIGQGARGLVAGLPLPICSCGILPVYESLLDHKAPKPAALAFLLGTPLLGLDALLISWPLFGPALTGARLAAAALAALLVALVVAARLPNATHAHGHAHGRAQDHAHDHDHAHASTSPPLALSVRLKEGLRFGLGELVDHLLPWLVFGFALAALFEPVLHESGLGDWPAWAQVLGAAALGLPLYVSASGATPLLAVLLHKGLGPGAAIAFLLTAPALNSETLSTLRNRHGTRTATMVAASLFAAAVALGLGTEALLGEGLGAHHSADMHRPSQHEHSLLSWISLAFLAGLALVSLIRSGARGWLGQLRVRYGEHVHHAHDGHACAHDHGHAHAHDHDHVHDHD